MKNFLRILILLQIVILFSACDSKEISPLLYKDEVDTVSSSKDADSLDYTIDKITLSQSYQSIEPNIEILKNGLDSKLLLSLGIVKSSGVNVEKIEKNDRDVNIYIQNEIENNEAELAVPQIIINFKDLSQKDLENLNFKIINQNYEPIDSSIDIGEAISKIKSSLKIATSTFPSSNIKQEDGKMLLDLNFKNAVDLTDKKNPIIDLHVVIDLIDGKIIKSDKNPVSSFIDEGDILEYIPNKYLFYVKKNLEINNTNYELWIYNINKDSKKKIYTSDNKISSLKFNDDKNKALIIESSGDNNQLHILELDDLKVHRANLNKEINPSSAIWRDENILLIDKHDDSANIYSFNLSNDKSKLVSSVDKNIKQIQYLNDTFLFTIKNDKAEEIYLTKDFKKNTLIDRGEKPLFINNTTVAYLKNDNNTGQSVLWFYSLDNKSIEPYTDIDVQDYYIWKDSLVIVEKTQIGSENPLYIYNFEDRKIEFITSVKTDIIYIDKDILYLNSSVDFGENKTSIISFLDL